MIKLATMKILILGPSWVGDMVMMHSLVRYLHRSHPDAAIDIAAAKWCLPVATRMSEVRQCIELPYQHGVFSWAQTKAFASELKKASYDWCIVIPNSFKAALLPWLAGIPKRTGWRGEFRYGLLNDSRKLPASEFSQQVLRFAQLHNFSANMATFSAAEPSFLRPSLVCNPESAAQVASMLKLDMGVRPVVVLCPGAEYGESKRWPVRHFAALAEKLVAHHFQVWFMASAKEAALCEAILAKISSSYHAFCFNLAGKTTLVEAIELLSLASGVVANDSGLLHVASALSLPVVGLYGSTAPDFAPPLAAQASVFYRNLNCSPCHARVCPKGHLKCLYEIHPKEVLLAVLSFVSSLKLKGA